MIQMGLGMRGATNVAKGGFMLGLIVSVGIESIDFILDDEKTMYDLVGAIGVEAVKGGLAVAVGLLAAKGIAMAVGVAILPLITVAIIVGGVGIYLNWLDNTYNIKAAVIAALKETSANVNSRANVAARQFDIEFKTWIGYSLR